MDFKSNATRPNQLYNSNREHFEPTHASKDNNSKVNNSKVNKSNKLMIINYIN